MWACLCHCPRALYSAIFAAAELYSTNTNTVLLQRSKQHDHSTCAYIIEHYKSRSADKMHSRLEATLHLYMRILFVPDGNTCCIDAGTERQIKQTKLTTALQHPVTTNNIPCCCTGPSKREKRGSSSRTHNVSAPRHHSKNIFAIRLTAEMIT